MKVLRFVGVVACVVAVFAAIPLEAGQQASPPTSVCDVKAFCYNATNFTATITTFRISTNNVYKQKIIDVTIRFQNKTNQAVVLAYVDHSGLATDERGNRSIPWGPNAYRGIGLVSGTTFDPKLMVRPGGWGDAQFELVQQGTPPVTGATYMLDLTIDEINNSGGQPTLGGEFPLHFEGLINGASGTLPSLANFAGVPCAGQAANKASVAANTISNIGSIFGKKKTAQTAGQVATATAGCDAVANAATSSVGSATADNPSKTVAVANAPSQPVTDATPQQPVAPSAISNTGQEANRSAAANASRTHSSGPGHSSDVPTQSAEPWSPPTDVAADKAGTVDPLKLPEVAKMPDVIGVRLGMHEQQAVQILHTQYPRGRFQEIPANGLFPTNPKADYGFNILPTDVIATDVVVSLTAPPSQQVVWRVVRFTRRIHSNHANVLATLREKYGKETLAGLGNGTITTDDRLIGQLLWVFDEHGGRLPLPAPQTFGSATMTGIPCSNQLSDVGPRILMEETKSQDWCSSVVAILVTIDPMEIVENTVTNMVDMKLAARTANAYLAWKRDADAKARAAEIAKSKQNKPVF
jgi:hypothetical protein